MSNFDQKYLFAPYVWANIWIQAKLGGMYNWNGLKSWLTFGDLDPIFQGHHMLVKMNLVCHLCHLCKISCRILTKLASWLHRWEEGKIWWLCTCFQGHMTHKNVEDFPQKACLHSFSWTFNGFRPNMVNCIIIGVCDLDHIFKITSHHICKIELYLLSGKSVGGFWPNLHGYITMKDVRRD